MPWSRIRRFFSRLQVEPTRTPLPGALREYDALRATLKRAGIAFGDSYGSDYFHVSIGDQGAFRSTSTEDNFVQFEFDKDGRLFKVGIWKNWVSEPYIPPGYRACLAGCLRYGKLQNYDEKRAVYACENGHRWAIDVH